MPLTLEENIQFYYSLYYARDILLRKYNFQDNDGQKVLNLEAYPLSSTFKISHEQLSIEIIFKTPMYTKFWLLNIKENTIFVNYIVKKTSSMPFKHDDEYTINIEKNEVVNTSMPTNEAVQNRANNIERVDQVQILRSISAWVEKVLPNAQDHILEAKNVRTYTHTFFTGLSMPSPLVEIINNYTF